MAKYVVVYFDGGELVNAGYADELPPGGGVSSAGIYETGSVADGYPVFLLVPDWKYEPEQDESITASTRINPFRVAARIVMGYNPESPEDEKTLAPYISQILKITQGNSGKAYNLIYSTRNGMGGDLVEAAKHLTSLVSRYQKVQAAFQGVNIEADPYDPEDCWIDGFDDVCVHLEENGAQTSWGDGYHRTFEESDPLIPYDKLAFEVTKFQEAQDQEGQEAQDLESH
jgi:hypothetical protein